MATFTVTSPLDTGAVGELRWAVASANMTPGADLVDFDSSVASIQLTAGELLISDPVRIDGSASANGSVTIQASVNARVFRVDDGNPMTKQAVQMVRLSIGKGDVSAFPGGQGGGILNAEALHLENCIVFTSRAVTGGGLANFGHLTTKATTFSGNTATGDGGGGVWNAPIGTISFEGGSALQNRAVAGRGGAILNDGSSSVTIFGGANLRNNFATIGGGGLAVRFGGDTTFDDATIEMNAGPLGGGILAEGAGASIDATRLTTRFNQAGEGAGMALANHATATLRNSLVLGNAADQRGGGLHLSVRATATLIATEVTANEAGTFLMTNGEGGGIFAQDASEVTLLGSTINLNGATDLGSSIRAGGGVFAGSSSKVTVAQSTISGNVAQYGGGLYAVGSNNVTRVAVSLDESSIDNNAAHLDGGGILAREATDLTLVCTTVSGNSAFNGQGGGLQLVGSNVASVPQVEIRDSAISNNTAGIAGGGVSMIAGVALDVVNSIVSGNSAIVRGGGFQILSGPSSVVPNSAHIRLSLISGNAAGDPNGMSGSLASGGGVWVGGEAEVTIESTMIEDNRAEHLGGGIALDASHAFRLQDSTVTGNRSLKGGGLAAVSSSAILSQSTFDANSAAMHGGGVYIFSLAPDVLSVLHSTLSGNKAASSGLLIGQGGGVYIRGSADNLATVELNHTIISGNRNSALATHDEVFDGTALSGSSAVAAAYSLIRDSSGTLLAPGNPDPDGNLIGTSMAPIDALLGPLSTAGGPTLTRVPLNGSPVVNAGNPLFAIPTLGDQRQLPFKRVAFGRIDIGAVELQPPPPDPDFNDDGIADCMDIDSLVANIAAGANSLSFDLTGDGFVNRQDLDKWLDDAPDLNGLSILRYLPGDANLDTVVDGGDFGIWNVNKFTPGGAWCRADFNADGAVDGGDFGIWNGNKFTASPFPSGCGYHRDAGGARAPGYHHGETASALDQIIDDLARSRIRDASRLEVVPIVAHAASPGFDAENWAFAEPGLRNTDDHAAGTRRTLKLRAKAKS